MSTLVVGDISGYKEAFERLVLKSKATKIISLGDIIDRGPDSKELIDLFMKNPQSHRLILGNHEHQFIKIYEEVIFKNKSPYYAPIWIFVNGGQQTLISYGLDVPDCKYSKDEIINFTKEEKHAYLFSNEMQYIFNQFHKINIEHIFFLKSCPLYIENDSYFMTHAPVKVWNQPGLLDSKKFDENVFLLDSGCLWNRSSPKKKTRDDNKILIYGHNNVKKPLIHSEIYPFGQYTDGSRQIPDDTWAICLDTVKEGQVLTGFCLNDKKFHFEKI